MEGGGGMPAAAAEGAEAPRPKKRGAAEMSGDGNGAGGEGGGKPFNKKKKGGKGKGGGGPPGGMNAKQQQYARSGMNRDEMRPGSETPSNVIIARIAEGDYPVTIDALYTLFSFYGKVQKIVMFNKGAGQQALIQYPDADNAQNAYIQVDNRHMYTNSNLIRVGYSNLTNLVVRANNDRSWDYTRVPGPGEVDKADGAGEEEDGKAKVVAGPVDPAIKVTIRERILAEMPADWNKKLPGTDTCVLVVQGLNMEMVGAEALAALFGIYGDVVKIMMLPLTESALIQMDKPVQAHVCKWLLDSTPLAMRVIRVKPSMQEEIRDTQAQDFTDFPLHGYKKVQSPRDPAYLSNVIEPTCVLRCGNIDWDTSENSFRAMLTQQENLVDVHRVTSQSDSPALVVFNSIEAAVHASILLHNQEIDGKNLYVTFSEITPGVTY